MTRQLPIVHIAGTAFYVDVLREWLQQQSNPVNRISFDAFTQERNGYTFIYDNMRRNAAAEGADLSDERRFCSITLPALMELDPEGIALKYNIPIEVLCPDRAGDTLDMDDEDEFYDENLL